MALFFDAGPAIGCSALGLVEVVCTLIRKARAGEMAFADALAKCREAESDFALFHKVFLTPVLLSKACDCAKHHGLRGADTVHLASCQELRRGDDGRSNDVILISSDTELLAGAKASGIATVDPERMAIPLGGETRMPADGVSDDGLSNG
jgi:predicted nucleic acid-binding protein